MEYGWLLIQQKLTRKIFVNLIIKLEEDEMKKSLKKALAWYAFAEIPTIAAIFFGVVALGCIVEFNFSLKNAAQNNQVVFLLYYFLAAFIALVNFIVAVSGEDLKKSFPSFWFAKAKKIKQQYPKTEAVLYFLERGDLSYLIEWINSFEKCEKTQTEILRAEKKKAELLEELLGLREVLLQEGEIAELLN